MKGICIGDVEHHTADVALMKGTNGFKGHWVPERIGGGDGFTDRACGPDVDHRHPVVRQQLE